VRLWGNWQVFSKPYNAPSLVECLEEVAILLEVEEGCDRKSKAHGGLERDIVSLEGKLVSGSQKEASSEHIVVVMKGRTDAMDAKFAEKLSQVALNRVRLVH
jgi:hypothetical protein